MKRAHDASRRGLFSSAKLNTKQLFKFGTVPALYPLLSIHAPRAGCDHAHSDDYGNLTISIHAPRAGCDVRLDRFHFITKISIHAPRAGCDPPSPSSTRLLSRFQSTHPVRGATAAASSCWLGRVISIHAPRAGCDSVHLDRLAVDLQFQSTHPVRGATARSRGHGHYRQISIHAPRAGCDQVTAEEFKLT